MRLAGHFLPHRDLDLGAGFLAELFREQPLRVGDADLLAIDDDDRLGTGWPSMRALTSRSIALGRKREQSDGERHDERAQVPMTLMRSMAILCAGARRPALHRGRLEC